MHGKLEIKEKYFRNETNHKEHKQITTRYNSLEIEGKKHKELKIREEGMKDKAVAQ